MNKCSHQQPGSTHGSSVSHRPFPIIRATHLLPPDSYLQVTSRCEAENENFLLSPSEVPHQTMETIIMVPVLDPGSFYAYVCVGVNVHTYNRGFMHVSTCMYTYMSISNSSYMHAYTGMYFSTKTMECLCS